MRPPCPTSRKTCHAKKPGRLSPQRDPQAPTAGERAAHEATHLPFRSWCIECVAGRLDNPPHRRVEQEENAVPEVLMDYCFVRRDDECDTITILVMKDRKSRALQAWVLESRGLDVQIAPWMASGGLGTVGPSC